MMKFDECYLEISLSKLDVRKRAVFAASCAERLYPAFSYYASRFNVEGVEILRKSLDYVWDDLTQNTPKDFEGIFVRELEKS